jgi:hypothetical protein
MKRTKSFYKLFLSIVFSFRKKLPVKAAKPATRPPISAVIIINKYGLSVLKINKEMRCARIFPLLMLIHKLKNPHNKNSAIKPEINEGRCPYGMSMGIIKATIAIVHHGKYRDVRKLNSIIRIVFSRNFIFLLYRFIYFIS